MKVTVDMVGRGVKDGLRTTWELAKVIIPVYFLQFLNILLLWT